MLSSPIALILSYFPVKILYHEHDSQTGPSKTTFMRICRQTLDKLAKRADACVLPNEKRLKRFVQKTLRDKLSVCVRNCPAKIEAKAKKKGEQHEGAIFYYQGSIVPERFPQNIIKALAGSGLKSQIKTVGYETSGSVGYVKALKNKAKEVGILEQVEFIGSKEYLSEVMDICRSCDVGLALLPRDSHDENIIDMVGASNKVFEYMACGLPVIVSDIPEWVETFVKPGYALACDPEDPKSIEGVMKWFAEHPEVAKEMGEKGRQKILSDWNYEKQFETVSRIIMKDG